MYFHPLQEEIGNMSEEEISNRIKELSRKVAIARRGRNPEMLANLQMALRTYQDAIRQRRIEEWHKNNKKLRNEPDIGDLINID
jgi:DNA-binding Lrp family transcriptional regulator